MKRLLLVLAGVTVLPLVPWPLACAAAAEPIKVFLLAGQSNMEGKGDGTKLTADERRRLAAVQPRVSLAYNREPVRPLDIAPASAGNRKRFGIESSFGPELFFGLLVAEALPGQRVLLIKRSVGATSLHGRWNPDWSREKAVLMGEDKAEPLYPDFIAYVREVLATYRPDEYELAGMLWVQGESDSNVSQRGEVPAESYGRNLRALIERVRFDVQAPHLPFLVVEVGGGKVVEGMRATAAAVPRVTFLPQGKDPAAPDFFPKHEVGHYNYEGMKRMGSLLAAAWLREYGGGQRARR